MTDIALLATGGTIATKAAAGGRSVQVSAAELLSAAEVAGAPTDVRVSPQDTAATVSFAATTGDILALADAVRDAVTWADGVVITHGTDTLEETAMVLALSHTGDQPVVLTGAQRPFDDPAPDGPHNLATALSWVCAPEARGTGVAVAFDATLLPAVGVRKTHTLALNAFTAADRGPLGHVDESGLRALGHAPQVPLLPSGLRELPDVEVLVQYLGAAPRVADSAAGVVLAGFGTGNATPPTMRLCLDLLATGSPVLVTSRTGAGPVTGLYAGGGADLEAAGAVFAGDLSPWQGRILLAAALAVEDDADRVNRCCREWLQATGTVALPREGPR